MPANPEYYKIGDTLMCPICGKWFIKLEPLQAYCSSDCQIKAIENYRAGRS